MAAFDVVTLLSNKLLRDCIALCDISMTKGPSYKVSSLVGEVRLPGLVRRLPGLRYHVISYLFMLGRVCQCIHSL